MRALHSVHSDPSIDEISADDLLGSYPAVQYIPPDGDFHIDLLTRLGTAFAYRDLEVMRVPLGDLDIAVVRSSFWRTNAHSRAFACHDGTSPQLVRMAKESQGTGGALFERREPDEPDDAPMMLTANNCKFVEISVEIDENATGRRLLEHSLLAGVFEPFANPFDVMTGISQRLASSASNACVHEQFHRRATS